MHRPAPARPALLGTGTYHRFGDRASSSVRGRGRGGDASDNALWRTAVLGAGVSDDEDEDVAPLNVGDYRRQAQRTLMLSHLRESSASFPGLADVDWAHLDNAGLHAAVSAIVRVHAALRASGQQEAREAAQLQQQLSQVYAAASKAGGTPGLTEEQLSCIQCVPCDEETLASLTKCEKATCAICHEDYKLKDELRTLPQCEHTYHSMCIGHWLRIKAACPLCNCTVKVKPVDERGGGDTKR